MGLQLQVVGGVTATGGWWGHSRRIPHGQPLLNITLLTHNPLTSSLITLSLSSHTLLQVTQKLYVMGGQREKQPLSDMLTYDLQSDETAVLANGKDTHSKRHPPVLSPLLSDRKSVV